MGMATRAIVLGSKRKVQLRKVLTPEWGDKAYVYVRALRANEGNDLKEYTSTDIALVAAGWCVLGICDGNGKRQYGRDDIDALANEPFKVIQRCADAIMDINGFTADAETTQKKTRRPRASLRVSARKRTRHRRR